MDQSPSSSNSVAKSSEFDIVGFAEDNRGAYGICETVYVDRANFCDLLVREKDVLEVVMLRTIFIVHVRLMRGFECLIYINEFIVWDADSDHDRNKTEMVGITLSLVWVCEWWRLPCAPSLGGHPCY